MCESQREPPHVRPRLQSKAARTEPYWCEGGTNTIPRIPCTPNLLPACESLKITRHLLQEFGGGGKEEQKKGSFGARVFRHLNSGNTTEKKIGRASCRERV